MPNNRVISHTGRIRAAGAGVGAGLLRAGAQFSRSVSAGARGRGHAAGAPVATGRGAGRARYHREGGKLSVEGPGQPGTNPGLLSAVSVLFPLLIIS